MYCYYHYYTLVIIIIIINIIIKKISLHGVLCHSPQPTFAVHESQPNQSTAGILFQASLLGITPQWL